jgi:hypothetical protein
MIAAIAVAGIGLAESLAFMFVVGRFGRSAEVERTARLKAALAPHSLGAGSDDSSTWS